LIVFDIVRFVFYVTRMDTPRYRSRNYAIERNRERALAVVADLFAMIGLAAGGIVERVPRPVYRKAMRVLRSAESAVRRLIISAARNIVVEPKPQRPAPAECKSTGESKAKSQGEGKQDGTAKRKRRFLFNLFDRPRRKDWGIPGRRRKRRGPEPRVHVFDFGPRIPAFLRPQPAPAPAPIPKKPDGIDDGTVSAIRLCRRIFAMAEALADIQHHAMRYARWEAKPIEQRRPRRASPFRLGWPPGWRIRPTHEVDDILKDCHWLVHETQFDTS
jgi:hypothetical protein